MRILKYIFLLLLLSLVTLSIFIATQKGDYMVERSKIINSPRSAVFNYVNDYRNWADFGSWAAEDPEMKFIYPQNTIGKGASYTWEGKDGSGEMQTVFVKENDSISQKMNYNDYSSTVSWKFKDTLGGTKVTWRTEGKMNFLFKIYSALNGGVNAIIGTMYEKSLANLDKALDYEMNTFSVKANGLVNTTTKFYLGQSFTSEIAKINKNFKIVVPKITTFCKENDIIVNGKPFIIYHTYDLVKGLAKVSICVPINREIFISAGSDIVSGKLEAAEMVKTTLTGDYSHLKNAYDQAVTYLNQNQLKRAAIISHIETYTVGKSEIKSPSKWITEVCIPLPPKVVPVAPATVTSETAIDPEAVVAEPAKTTINKKPAKPATPKNKEEEEPSEF